MVKRAALAAAVTALAVALFAAGCAVHRRPARRRRRRPARRRPAMSRAPRRPPWRPPRRPDPLPTYRPSPRPKGSLTLPGGTAKPGSTLTLTGTVIGGVEGGCLLLDGYLLLNPNPRVVREGARVTVTGEVRQDMVTTCQQGTPFMIRTAEPA